MVLSPSHCNALSTSSCIFLIVQALHFTLRLLVLKLNYGIKVTFAIVAMKAKWALGESLFLVKTPWRTQCRNLIWQLQKWEVKEGNLTHDKQCNIFFLHTSTNSRPTQTSEFSISQNWTPKEKLLTTFDLHSLGQQRPIRCKCHISIALTANGTALRPPALLSLLHPGWPIPAPLPLMNSWIHCRSTRTSPLLSCYLAPLPLFAQHN